MSEIDRYYICYGFCSHTIILFPKIYNLKVGTTDSSYFVNALSSLPELQHLADNLKIIEEQVVDKSPLIHVVGKHLQITCNS